MWPFRKKLPKPKDRWARQGKAPDRSPIQKLTPDHMTTALTAVALSGIACTSDFGACINPADNSGDGGGDAS